jgi:WD40 repeat protein
MRRLVLYGSLAILPFISNACGRTTSPETLDPPRRSPTDVLKFSTPITLTDTGKVITVEPRVSIDPRGGFIVADQKEAQVRLYTESGELRGFFAGKGAGPNEFSSLSAAHRLPSGELIAVGISGKIAVFDSSGTKLLRTQQTPLLPIYDAQPLDGSRLVIAGRLSGGEATPLIHIWDLNTGTLVRSFFDVPAHPEELAEAYMFAGSMDIALRGDTIAAVFALSDSVYVFTPQGQHLRSIGIPYEHFRHLRDPMPDSDDPQRFQKWFESLSIASNVFWASDGSVLIQYFEMKGIDPQWRLLKMDQSGKRIFEVPDTPQLLAVDSSSPSMYFRRPLSNEPTEWSVAHLR